MLKHGSPQGTEGLGLNAGPTPHVLGFKSVHAIRIQCTQARRSILACAQGRKCGNVRGVSGWDEPESCIAPRQATVHVFLPLHRARIPADMSLLHFGSGVNPLAQLPAGVPKAARLTPVMTESGPLCVHPTVCAWSYSPVTPHVPGGYADERLPRLCTNAPELPSTAAAPSKPCELLQLAHTMSTAWAARRMFTMSTAVHNEHATADTRTRGSRGSAARTACIITVRMAARRVRGGRGGKCMISAIWAGRWRWSRCCRGWRLAGRGTILPP